MTQLSAPTTATGHVLHAMLEETIDLMEETSLASDAAAGHGPPTPRDAAASLRIAARLARVCGWLMAQTGSAEVRARARAALLSALHSDLDKGAHAGAADISLGRGLVSGVGALADIAIRVDRLAARAVRLDDLLSGRASMVGSGAPTVVAPALSAVFPFGSNAGDSPADPSGGP